MTNKNYPLASTTWDELEYLAMDRVIKSGNFTMGKEVQQFERNFADHFGAKYAVMSNSGSSANLLALAAMRYSTASTFPLKDEVIVPAVSWSTTFYPIAQMGYKLKFVDVDIETLNMDLSGVLNAIDYKTAGIVAVNLLGNPCELDELNKIAAANSIFLIEDNCESMGAQLNSKYAGSFGVIGTFSSFFSHHISTMEGGMSLTDDLEIAQIMTSMRAHGWTRELPKENKVFDKTGNSFEDSFRFVLPGYNLRPLELSGAIGNEQLKKLPGFVKARRENAEYFRTTMQDLEGIRLQKETGTSSWFGFSMILGGKFKGRRQEIVSALEENQIDSRPIVAGNFTKNPVMKHLPHVQLPEFPNADSIHTDGLFVGNHHYNLFEQIDLLAKTFKKF